MTTQNSLAGKTAIVTGASSGIGRAIAGQLAAAGAHVFLGGRTAAAMQHCTEQIADQGGQATMVVGDITQAGVLQSLIDQAVAQTGRLDIMVNNAGLSFSGSILEGDPEHWRTMLDTNVLALLVGCQAAVRAMRACNAEGQIVNISSVVAQRPNGGVYAATKHAVNVISASLRDELEQDTIRITNVMPGAIATNFARNFDVEFSETMLKMAGIDAAPAPGGHLASETLEALANNMQQLLGNPEDVANAVMYAVTQPIHVNIADIVVRPPKSFDVAH
jgi:NADP-dependent 3-hydroxy acid dehydrogenase YdfG